jgi:PAS domain S-box-containing protein
MPVPSLEVTWALFAATLVFTALASGIIAMIALHSRKIREAEARFRHLFEKVFDAIILLDENYRIIDVNEATCRLLGRPKEELVTLPLESLIPQEKWPFLYMEFIKSLKSRLDYLGETELIDVAGKSISAEVGVTCLELKGTMLLLASIRDIGATRQARDALEKKNTTLTDVLTHLEEEKMKYRSEVALAIDHVIMPELQDLLNGNDIASMTHYKALKESLEELAYSSGGMLLRYGKLSPREIEICNMIKSGASSKSIAEILSISPQTVKKHRERIRRKLVISNKDINLSTYLKKQNN